MLKEESEYIDILFKLEDEIRKSLQQIHKKYKNKLIKAKEKASKDCKHNFYSVHNVDCDDGYGKQWVVKNKICKVCGKEDIWHKWPLEE